MPRGQKASPGDTRIAPNGYSYTRTETEWRLTHHLIAEDKLERRLEPDERCTFKDGDRTNLHPDNIVVSRKAKKSAASRRAYLEAKIEEMQLELASLED